VSTLRIRGSIQIQINKGRARSKSLKGRIKIHSPPKFLVYDENKKTYSKFTMTQNLRGSPIVPFDVEIREIESFTTD
jgi:hypothetical protein